MKNMSLGCVIVTIVLGQANHGLAQSKPASAPQQAKQPAPNKTPAQSSAPANNAPTTQPAPPAPDLSIPAGANPAALSKIVATAKGFRPRSPAEYKLQQNAIRDASNLLVKQIENKDDPVRLQAELDALAANAALMVNESDEARDKVFEKIVTYLKARKQLSLADVQTGMIVAAYLELQPRKQPSHDVYATMVDLLKDDPREEMQELRLNLQATLTRLEMLGKKLELDVLSIDGKEVRIQDFEGKFLILGFFASWNKPSLAEIQRLKKHYDKHHAKGLEVVTICIESERAELDKFIAETKITWPVVHDIAPKQADKLQTRYGVSSLPTLLLVNKEGVVVSLEAHGAELDRLMDRLFETPTPAEPQTK